MRSKIVQMEGLKLVGMHWFGKDKEEISDLWCKLFDATASIPNIEKCKIFYGISYMEGNEPTQEHFHYLAGFEVDSVGNIPEGMKCKEIPAGKYAVYTHKGSLFALNETYKNIYSKWLAEDSLVPAGDYCFELYDERFDANSENSAFDIYVPVK